MVLELWSVHLEVGNVGDIVQDTFFLRGSMESFISCLCKLTWAVIGARIERKIDLTFNDVSVVSMRTICIVLGCGEVVSRSVSNQRIDERVEDGTL